MLQSCSSLLARLASASGPVPACGAAAAQIVQQIARNSSSTTSSAPRSSSLRWNYNPHQIPQAGLPKLQVPPHDLEEGLPEVDAWLREHTGTNQCSKLRKAGATPCVLFSLPGNTSVTLAMDTRDATRLVRQFGRNGLQAQVLRVNIYGQQPQRRRQDGDGDGGSSGSSSGDGRAPGQQPRRRGKPREQPEEQQEQAAAAPAADAGGGASSSGGSGSQPLASVRVLPKQVHINSVTLGVENLSVMFCPRDRRDVAVNVPVKLWNDDVAPGVRAGGWLHVVNRSVPLRAATGAAVPRRLIELDMRGMRARDVVRYSDVQLPEGCRLAAKDPSQPVVRCAVRVGGD